MLPSISRAISILPNMCGCYTLTADLKKVADRFGAPMVEGSTHPCPSEEGNKGKGSSFAKSLRRTGKGK